MQHVLMTVMARRISVRTAPRQPGPDRRADTEQAAEQHHVLYGAEAVLKYGLLHCLI